MTSNLPHKRPNCEEILNRKNKWALNEQQLVINDELKDIIDSKERESESTIYSLLRIKFNANQLRVLGNKADCTVKDIEIS